MALVEAPRNCFAAKLHCSSHPCRCPFGAMLGLWRVPLLSLHLSRLSCGFCIFLREMVVAAVHEVLPDALFGLLLILIPAETLSASVALVGVGAVAHAAHHHGDKQKLKIKKSLQVDNKSEKLEPR